MKKLWLVLFIPAIFVNCSDDNNLNRSTSSDWLIPQNEVFDGGPGKDGIHAKPMEIE